ncbi:hypothetical protein [Gloeobacter kilaueensis]|uniref:Uncharacterized protein n=1 Tax=Gloeobacter kilaueensis (strain ATCC BAA-2537 / CCAP 1431/1 / ULC 316 / JS1) TaxID=1183438 RepID=U5QD37_GLOK1|nr:hypothetical protein [Gloeobacter kilaueensis]AGY56807.1 hypothetical protein GKIL_0561 [Gloeobacter kilaueensis JS1]
MNEEFSVINGRIWGFEHPGDMMPVPLPLAMTSNGLMVHFFGEAAQLWERKGWARPVHLPYRFLAGGGLLVIESLLEMAESDGFLPAVPLPVLEGT